jgi:hypothetical protein
MNHSAFSSKLRSSRETEGPVPSIAPPASA